MPAPVLFTVTAACVTVFPTRSLPKLKAVELMAEVVDAAPTIKDVMPLWDNEPAEPVTETAVVAAVTEAKELRLNWPMAPGITESVDGVAVTPAGKLASEMDTAPVKPFTGVTPTERDRVPPAGIVSVVGATCSEKSGVAAAETVRDEDPLWVNEPDDPLTEIAVVAAAVDVEEVKLNWPMVPADNESVAGEAVTPVGKLASETETVPVNPLTAITPTDRACVPPAGIEIVDGATSSAKSAGAAAPMVKDEAPLCVNEPDVPLTAIGVVPAAAEAEELRLI